MIILQDTSIEVDGPQEVVSALQEWLAQLDAIERKKEYFFVLLLDTRNQVLVTEVVSIGTLNASLVHPREVFVRAVQMHAASLLIAHNHPSGAAEPSDADTAVTRRIKDAGKLMGIELVDHVILSDAGYYSFVEHKQL
jgi:DNA repair protein RadC